jgi:hypothetical protein
MAQGQRRLPSENAESVFSEWGKSTSLETKLRSGRKSAGAGVYVARPAGRN